MGFRRLLQLSLLAVLNVRSVKAWESGPDPDDIYNWYLSRSLVYTWLALAGALIIWANILRIHAYVRTAGCLNNDQQRFFSMPNHFYGVTKRYLIDAPLFRTRHHREFKLSNAINVGTLPSRPQTLFLIAYLVMSITLTTYNIQWHGGKDKIIEQVLKRTGFMAVMNMLPLFLLAGRNNPLIVWTGITFDTYNLVHRWLGRICVLEAIVHFLSWLIHAVDHEGWAAVKAAEQYSTFILSGTIAGAAFTLILFQSPSIFRHAFYETFLHVHIALAALAVGGVWVHLKDFRQQRKIIYLVLSIWVIERSVRLIRIVYRNFGQSTTKAEVEALPGDAVRITMKMARPWTFVTGQHAYLYLPAVGWWTSHPFSAAWSEEEEEILSEKGLPVAEQDVLQNRRTSISFIVRRRTGFTEKLYKKAAKSPGGKFTSFAICEGPYGHQKLHSYGTVLLFAAGIGITHHVPHVRDLVTGYANGSIAARRVVLIWIVQSPEHLEWIRPWMATILSLPRRREVLKILLFVTRPRNSKEIHSPSSSVQMFPGKPNVQSLIDQEVESAVGAVGVSVCGVGALADDVRKACRSWMDKVTVDFMEESFSW